VGSTPTTSTKKIRCERFELLGIIACSVFLWPKFKSYNYLILLIFVNMVLGLLVRRRWSNPRPNGTSEFLFATHIGKTVHSTVHLVVHNSQVCQWCTMLSSLLGAIYSHKNSLSWLFAFLGMVENQELREMPGYMSENILVIDTNIL